VGQASTIDHRSVGSARETVAVATRAADASLVDEVLGLLARALQQVQTYPASSPMSLSAIEAVHGALEGLVSRDRLAFRVTPSDVIVDETAVGGGTPVGRELATRLHRAGVATVILERGAPSREIARFCQDLVRCSARRGPAATLLEVLTDHGVERVQVEMARRPEILDVGVIPDSTAATLARERARTELSGRGGAVHHLYPPQKGWVRLDPASAQSSISLLDLTVLAEDPATLASMLMRLTGDEADVTPDRALQAKYSDVARLIAALDPPLARRLFAKLARAVLDLDASNRQALLRRTVLPGLLDGRIDGAILRDFPDVELAESLCLLLDLETAAPELLATALSRLDLSAERHASVAPLLDARLRDREAAHVQTDRQTMLVKHARELVRVDPAEARSFAEFCAFDLSIDDSTRAALAAMRDAVPADDMLAEQLICLAHLLTLEPNPEAACRYLDKSFELLAALEHAARGDEVPPWLGRYRDVSERLRAGRPDVADAIVARLETFCTPERAAWLVGLVGEDAHHTAAAGVIVALGPAVVPSLVRLLERGAEKEASRQAQERGRTAARLLAQHAAAVAPAIPPLLDTCVPAVRRALLRVLGAAGPGYEDDVAPHAAGSDEPTGREALRALARIGTPKAAALVVAEITRQHGILSVAAEETLWHFPSAEAERRTRDLLARREFILRHPQAAERLLDRAARGRRECLEPVLAELASLRFRIWSPAVARVARKAHRLLQREV